MALCEFANQTLAVADLNFPPFVAIQNRNVITGGMGSCLDRLLCKKQLRKCTVIGHNDLGSKQVNGSYSGILGLLESKQVDAYLVGVNEFIDEPWLKKTVPFRTEEIGLGHEIHERVDIYDLMMNFNLGIEVVSSNRTKTVPNEATDVVLNEASSEGAISSFKSKKFSSLASLFFNNQKLSIKLFLLFFGLFQWHAILFLTNSIKTNKVVIDTSDLVKNKEDILNTKKVSCFIENESEIKIAQAASKDSIMNRIYKEKTYLREEMTKERTLIKSDRCVIRKETSMFWLIESNLLIIGSESLSYFAFLLLASVDWSLKTWLLQKDVYQYNLVLYYNDRNPINQAIFGDKFSRYTESGLMVAVYKCTEINAYMALRRKVPFYTSIARYVDENTGFSDLVFGNFQTIFLVYFSICLLILCAHLVHVCVNYFDYYLCHLKLMVMLIWLWKYELIRLTKKIFFG